MFSSLYNRLLGWFSLVLLGTALTGHTVGNYIQFTQSENILNGTIGAIALFAARRRKRYSTSIAMILGACFFIWGVLGMTGIRLPSGVAEPLENAIRTVIGMWGVYVASHDVLKWRREQLAS